MKNVLTKKMLAMRVVFGTATVAFSCALSTTTSAAKHHTATSNRVVRVQTKQGGEIRKGDVPVKPQIDLKVTLENSPEVVEGEPLVLHYTFTNTSPYDGDEFAADFGERYAKLVTLKLVGEDGTALPSLPQPPRRRTYGASVSPNFLMTGQSRDGFVVVTQRFALPHKGKYTLAVAVDVPYTRYNPNGPTQMLDIGNLRATGLAIQGKYTFSITVREAKPGDLVDAANRIRKRFVASRNAGQKERLATALFSMSPNEVLPVWKRLAYESTAFDRPIVAKALAQTLKNEAADVLVRMELSHSVRDNDGNAVSVMQTISEMSDAGSPELQKHIKGLFAAYRLQVPSYPSVID